MRQRIGTPRPHEPLTALIVCWAGLVAGYLERIGYATLRDLPPRPRPRRREP